ncbi:MAG: hypothetical protein K6F05_02085 [Succinivibrio sp.]|nr:hypothetical protein [Succinivibrio sp.]
MVDNARLSNLELDFKAVFRQISDSQYSLKLVENCPEKRCAAKKVLSRKVCAKNFKAEKQAPLKKIFFCALVLVGKVVE